MEREEWKEGGIEGRRNEGGRRRGERVGEREERKTGSKGENEGRRRGRRSKVWVKLQDI